MTACETRVRAIIRKHYSLRLSELFRLAGHPEAEVRAVLYEMERGDEGYFSPDLPTDEEWFTRFARRARQEDHRAPAPGSSRSA